jgi:hypothetical protein
MKRRGIKKEKIERLIEAYARYRDLKKVADQFPRKELPPFSLDERLEQINPFYIRSYSVKYE